MIDPRLADWDEAVRMQAKCRQECGPVHREWAIKAAQEAGASDVMATMLDCDGQIGVLVRKGGERHGPKVFPVDQAVIAEIYRWVKAL